MQDDTKHRLDTVDLIAQSTILLIAGQDTTVTYPHPHDNLLLNQPQANTLAFGLRELAKHPEFQERLRVEIHSTMGRSVGAEFAYDNMPVLNAFIKVNGLLMPELG